MDEYRLEYQRSKFHFWRSLILKYYGSISNAETPGLSWEEIADLIDKYTNVSGLQLAWSRRLVKGCFGFARDTLPSWPISEDNEYTIYTQT